MRILIADKFQEAYLKDLNNLGHEITLNPDLKAEDLSGVISGYDVLIVRSTKVKKDAIDASDELSLIIRAGAGTNTIDVAEAAKKGIFVCNTPGKNSIAVAELAMGLILSIDRNIPDCVADLRSSKWNKKKYTKADGLYGKQLGIIGLGEIGQEVAKRAHSFGIKVVGYDPIALQNMPVKLHSLIENGVLEFAQTREEMLKSSDIISIHVPSNPHTQHMVNKDFLSHVKSGAVLINTSRGNIVVDEDLIEAMNSKGIRAGLDVYNDECATATGEFATSLSQHPNVYGTHHIGASTEQAQNAIAEEVINVLKHYEEGVVLHPVNIELKPETKHTLAMRIFDRVGALASVFHLLKEKGINVEQLESKVFTGENAQYIAMHVASCPDEETVEAIRELDNVIQAELKSVK